MANANIDALYVGSLRKKYHISFPRNFTFYKWCVTKVAHCISESDLTSDTYSKIFLIVITIFIDFSLTVKAAPHECVIRTGQP